MQRRTHTHKLKDGIELTERYYSFSLVTYNTKESDIQPLLDKANKWAWILHDKDKADPHIHIICTFKQNKSFEVVRKMVEGEQNTFVEPLRDKYKAFQYLTHENEDEEKAAYEESEVHCNDTSYFQKGLSKSVDNTEFVYDLLDSKMSLAEKIIKYGRDYARNFRTYEVLSKRLKFEKHLEERIERGELIELPEKGEDYFALVKTGEVVQFSFDCECNKDKKI